VDVLAYVRHKGRGPDGDGPDGGPALESPALVRQGNMLACCFHPELAGDRRVHRLFAELCRGG
jgi:hypothetical protein